jgi:hypothetical protein
MSSDALTTYLQDHLAGALHAIELLKSMRDHFAGEPLGKFAAQMLAETEADHNVLATLTECAGGTAGGMKEWAAGAFLLSANGSAKLGRNSGKNPKKLAEVSEKIGNKRGDGSDSGYVRYRRP